MVSAEVTPQARLDEKEAAERKAGKAESEVADLSKRLVEMKMTEIERMNEASACAAAKASACQHRLKALP